MDKSLVSIINLYTIEVHLQISTNFEFRWLIITSSVISFGRFKMPSCITLPRGPIGQWSTERANR